MRFWPVLLLLCAFGTGLSAQAPSPATNPTPPVVETAIAPAAARAETPSIKTLPTQEPAPAAVAPQPAAPAKPRSGRPAPAAAARAVAPPSAKPAAPATAVAAPPAAAVRLEALPAAKPPAPAAAPPAAPPLAAPATAVAPVVPVGASIRGQLSLTSGGRPLRSDEAVDAVVYYRPAAPVTLNVPPAGAAIATERKTFSPRVLPVPMGTTVRFPNRDPILHNVFSTAKEASFDLGLYGRSEGESHAFTQPGVVRVFCNVHHSMVAHVLVMDTPYYVKPDAQGRFRLSNLPLGPGELFVWHERAQLWRKPYDLTADAVVPVPLELSKRKVPAHLNKTGQPYRRTRPDEY